MDFEHRVGLLHYEHKLLPPSICSMWRIRCLYKRYRDCALCHWELGD